MAVRGRSDPLELCRRQLMFRFKLYPCHFRCRARQAQASPARAHENITRGITCSAACREHRHTSFRSSTLYTCAPSPQLLTSLAMLRGTAISKNRRTPPTAALAGGIDTICGHTARSVKHVTAHGGTDVRRCIGVTLLSQ